MRKRPARPWRKRRQSNEVHHGDTETRRVRKVCEGFVKEALSGVQTLVCPGPLGGQQGTFHCGDAETRRLLEKYWPARARSSRAIHRSGNLLGDAQDLLLQFGRS